MTETDVKINQERLVRIVCNVGVYILNLIFNFSGDDPPEVQSTPMVTDKFAEEYNMNHRKRGKAIIFNHENFDIKEAVRAGTQIDVERLKRVLSKLHFEIEIHNDLDFYSIKQTITTGAVKFCNRTETKIH